MTPGQIIALIKDVVIVAAIGLVIYVLVNYGKDIVKVQDMAAVQKQIAANTATEARWREERDHADQNRDAQLAQVAGAIDKQRAPVYLMRPAAAAPNPGALPGNAGQAGNPACPTGGSDQGLGVDSRPAINALELKYSTALIECYAALDKWPTPEPATHIF